MIDYQCPDCGTYLDNARRLANHRVVCPARKRLQELYDQAKAKGMTARQAYEASLRQFQDEQQVSGER